MIRSLSLTLTIMIICLFFLPITALAYDDADGIYYDEYDYSCIKAFLDQESAQDGITNGQQINPAYDSKDPKTWTGVDWFEGHAIYIGGEHWSGKSLSGTLDVSGMTGLETLIIPDNQISAIDTYGTTALIEMNCAANRLATLDLRTNTRLNALNCSDNELAELDLRENKRLVSLDCSQNLLSELDISCNRELCELSCAGNGLNVLDLTENEKMQILICADNKLTQLVSKDSLYLLDCSNNRISYLDTSDSMLMVIMTQGNRLTQLKTALYASQIELTSLGNGYVELDKADSSSGPIIAKAVETMPGSFVKWEQDGREVGNKKEYNLVDGNSYDLTAVFLTLSASGERIKTNSHIEVTPSLQGGTWDYDETYLAADVFENSAVFTGLKAGVTRITYQLQGKAVSMDLTITSSDLPQIGQNRAALIILVGLALIVLSGSIVLSKKSHQSSSKQG